MSIPVHLGAAVVFDDRIDLFARSADGVPLTLRLTRAAAIALARELGAVLTGQSDAIADIPATLDHPETLSTQEPRAPP
jgi:hypothetical protein